MCCAHAVCADEARKYYSEVTAVTSIDAFDALLATSTVPTSPLTLTPPQVHAVLVCIVSVC